MSLDKGIQIAIDLAAINGILGENPNQPIELLNRLNGFVATLDEYGDTEEAMGITEQIVLEKILERNGF